MVNMAKSDPKSCLIRLLDKLADAQLFQLQEYAEFLAERYPKIENQSEPVEPVDIPRPNKESVIAAMKRLRESYPMLDQQKLLNDTSELMSAHMLAGESAETVVDKLEQVFRKHYDALQSDP